MNHPAQRRRSLFSCIVPGLAVLACLASTACAATEGSQASSPVVQKDLTRNAAIASAREDARRSYGSDWASDGNAQYESGFWVIDLYATSGYRLRYAISARDGSIRERNMVQ